MLNCKKNTLPEAVNLLTDELREWREQWLTHLDMATKKDLTEMEGRIGKAIQGAKAEILKALSDRDEELRAVRRLVTATGKLDEAIKENTPNPISGS